MPQALTRHALFNRLRGGSAEVRPPWAKADHDFTEACTLCHACEGACPQRIIVRGRAGYPVLDVAAAGCTFCGKCADACREPCFLPRTQAPWDLVATVSKACVEAKGVSCRMCESACDVDAIKFRPQPGGRSSIRIEAACTGCGACVSTCPVKAISIMPGTAPGATRPNLEANP